MRYLSHLELSRTMIRAFRRAAIPLAYTEGFHPMPRMAFASALAVGVESQGEYVDFETTREIAAEVLLREVNGCLLEGLGLEELAPVSAGAESLGELVNAARYSVRLEGEYASRPLGGELSERMNRATELKVSRERKGRTEELDVLPSIHHVAARDAGALEMILRVGGSGTARPDDVIHALFGAGASGRIVREDLLVLRNGESLSPLSDRLRERAPLLTTPTA